MVCGRGVRRKPVDGDLVSIKFSAQTEEGELLQSMEDMEVGCGCPTLRPRYPSHGVPQHTRRLLLHLLRLTVRPFTLAASSSLA